MIDTHKAPAMAGALFFCNGDRAIPPPPTAVPLPLQGRLGFYNRFLQGPYAFSINRPMLSFPSDPWAPPDSCRIMHTVSQELYHIFACLHSRLQKNMAFFQDRKWRRMAGRANTLQKNKSQTDLIHRTQKTARALRSGRFPLLRQAKDHLPILYNAEVSAVVLSTYQVWPICTTVRSQVANRVPLASVTCTVQVETARMSSALTS
mgnify:CR=1 FL=1